MEYIWRSVYIDRTVIDSLVNACPTPNPLPVQKSSQDDMPSVGLAAILDIHAHQIINLAPKED